MDSTPVERTTQLGGLGTVTERQLLEGWLSWHRETLLAKCAGLESAQLTRTTIKPSNLTLLGLVRHMAEVERWWFRRSFGGGAIGDVFTGSSDGNEGLDGVHAADAEKCVVAFALVLADGHCRLPAPSSQVAFYAALRLGAVWPRSAITGRMPRCQSRRRYLSWS
ncbi:mycothiol transferase [Streptomyces sp. NPDC055134]